MLWLFMSAKSMVTAIPANTVLMPTTITISIKVNPSRRLIADTSRRQGARAESIGRPDPANGSLWLYVWPAVWLLRSRFRFSILHQTAVAEFPLKVTSEKAFLRSTRYRVVGLAVP